MSDYSESELAEIDRIELAHRRLLATNPVQAARYFQHNQGSILEARRLQSEGRAQLPRGPQADDVNRAFELREFFPVRRLPGWLK